MYLKVKNLNTWGHSTTGHNFLDFKQRTNIMRVLKKIAFHGTRAFRILALGLGYFIHSPIKFINSLEVISTQHFKIKNNYMKNPAQIASLKSTTEAIVIPQPPPKNLPSVVPLNLAIDETKNSKPYLNVLIPGMRIENMSGGPNTAINFACRMGYLGVPIRFISTCGKAAEDHDPLFTHFESLTGKKQPRGNIEIICGSDRSKPIYIGANDKFLATAWWTAQMVMDAMPMMRNKKFIYFIQDFEPGLYPWGTEYALAMETYSMNIHPIFNTSILASHFISNKLISFDANSSDFKKHVFEPTFDSEKFRYDPDPDRKLKRLLFYARPNIARRNLFEIGIEALNRVCAKEGFQGNWELLFIGDKIDPIRLADGKVIKNAPWLKFDDYAKLLRNTDIVVSLMLSPHPSYLPFEAASCGALTITNSYGVKTAEILQNISNNIIVTKPTIAGVEEGLIKALRIHNDSEYRKKGCEIKYPRNWDTSFADVLPAAMEFWYDQSYTKSKIIRTEYQSKRIESTT